MTYSGSRSSFITFYPSVTLKQHMIINLKNTVLSAPRLNVHIHSPGHLSVQACQEFPPPLEFPVRYKLIQIMLMDARLLTQRCAAGQLVDRWVGTKSMWDEENVASLKKKTTVVRPPPPNQHHHYRITFIVLPLTFLISISPSNSVENSACHSLPVCPQPAFVPTPSLAADSSQRKWNHHPWPPYSPNTGTTTLLFTGNQWKSEG